MKRVVRRKRSPWTRLRPFWIVGIIFIGSVVWGGVKLATLPAFELKRLDVSGLSHVTRREVLARAAINRHANVWLLNRRAIEARVEAIPYVLTARVRRAPLANVTIDVSERVPDACVRDAESTTMTIDRAFRVLEEGCVRAGAITYTVRSRLATEPGAFLSDAELKQLENDARALGPDIARFHAFGHDRYGDLDATMRDGIAVEFGDDSDLDRKDRLIDPILAQLGPRARRVAAVDLRAPSTPVVRYHPGCATCTAPI